MTNEIPREGGWIHHRRQFPVRLLCFAMTINKAQDQSLGTVGHEGHGRSEVLILHLRLSLGMILTKSNDKHITVIRIPFQFKVVCTVDYGLTKR